MAYIVSHTGANGVKSYAAYHEDFCTFTFAKEEAYPYRSEITAKRDCIFFNENESLFIHDFNAAKLPTNLLWEIEKI